jgi:single-strand DNA-binding protein
MNKAILMGRLTKDPEIRYTSNTNTAVCSFGIAISRQFVKQGEERQADFIDIVAYGKTAEFCSKYFSKGKMMAVVGRIQTRTYDDKEGKKRYVTEVIAEEVHFTESKKTDDTPAARPFGNTVVTPSVGGNSPAQSDGFYPMDEEDELPF